jgi:CheY-like chemotaxis protein
MSDFNQDDELLFADETETESHDKNEKNWKILIVDDEADVHKVTKLVLSDIEFSGRKVEFLSAYSEAEARVLLKENEQISVVLLDVVMENDDSGLQLIKYIREELHNTIIRIILRTGQPGQAPEQEVILHYDINDYKSKTELTTEKLFSSIITGIRSYRDLVTIEKNKNGLEKIIDASANIFEVQSLQNFVSGILTQLVSILHYNNDAFYYQISGFTATSIDGAEHILAATGKYSNLNQENDIRTIVESKIYSMIEEAFTQKKNVFDENHYIAYFKSQNGNENIIYFGA